MMQELSWMRMEADALEDNDRQYVLDLLEGKKSLLRENEELRC